MEKKIGILLILSSSFLAGIGQLFWKQATFSSYDMIFLYLLDIYFLAGCFFYFFATLLMMLSFRYAEYSLLFPMLSLSYVWVTLLSVLIFKDEDFHFGWMTGAFFISIGVFFLARSKVKNG